MTPEGLLALAATCVLQSSETWLEGRACDGADCPEWTERVELELVAGGPCDHVDISVPPGVEVVDVGGRVKLFDAGRRVLREDRIEPLPQGLDDRGVLRLHTPELRASDVAFVSFTRLWHEPTPFVWAPGAERAAYAGLHVAPDAHLTIEGMVEVDGAGWLWAVDPPTTTWVEAHPEGDAGAAASALPAGAKEASAHHARVVTLHIPPGDPQMHLVPGGASSATVVDTYTLDEPGPLARFVPIVGDAANASVACEPAESLVLSELRTGGLLGACGPDATALTVTHALDDAPTYGETPVGGTLSVVAEDGEVSWEEGAWALRSWDGVPIIPDRERLVTALDRRFRALMIPGPAVPRELRKEAKDWDLVVALISAALGRVQPSLRMPADPLQPRRLSAVRRSGYGTSVELSLLLHSYLEQVSIPSSWLLVRPAGRGDGHVASPAGFVEGMVRVVLDGEERFVDLGCRWCAPFEVRPELIDAAVLGASSDRTPQAVVPAVVDASIDDQRVRWRLEGPAALQLRLDLGDVPVAGRTHWLAERVGGAGATLKTAQRVGLAGSPVLLFALPVPDGVPPDPLGLPAAGADGTVFMPWTGEWRATLVQSELTPTAMVRAKVEYHREPGTDGRMVERLVVHDRHLSPEDVASIRAARTWWPPASPADG